MENKQTQWSELIKLAYTNHTKAPKVNRTKKAQVVTEPTEEQDFSYAAGGLSIDAVGLDFIKCYKGEVRYVPQTDKWAVWKGHVWEWDETGQVVEKVKKLARNYLKYSQGLSKKDPDKEAFKGWYKRLLLPVGAKELLQFVQTDPMIVASLEDFDADMYELNTPAGVVDLVTGEMSAPDPSRLMRRSTTITPDANCPTPNYDKLLSQAFFGQPELSEYFDQMMGITLVKAQDAQVFVYLHGEAGSGKGTLMNIAQDILGTDNKGYAAYVDSGLFVKSNHQQHPTEMMQFLGARMVVSSEITQGQKMDTGKLKKTTGGDKITGRYMGKDFVTFEATHTLWLMANHRLEVPHDDKGVWRRLRVIPFNYAKKESEFIEGLQRIIYEEEGPGILARWIAKANEYFADGYTTPQVVIDAREDYKAEQDTVAAWIDSCADTSEVAAFTSGGVLRDSYSKWCKRENKSPIGERQFAQALEAKGYSRDRQRLFSGAKSVTRGFMGIQIAEPVSHGF